MGLEAYRLGVQFQDNLSIGYLRKTLETLGAKTVNIEYNGEIQMEIISNKGIIEFLLSKIVDREKVLEKITGKKFFYTFSSKKNIGKTVLSIRFAKINPVEIIDELIELIKGLNMHLEIKFVWDIESNCEVNQFSSKELKKRYIVAQKEFNKWFNLQCRPIRCSEVFKDINNSTNN